MNYYYKRDWEETSGEPLTASWGTSTYFFETSDSGEVLRQVQVFYNGEKLKYDSVRVEDEYGGLADVPLDLNEFEEFKIEKDFFENAWHQRNADGE